MPPRIHLPTASGRTLLLVPAHDVRVCSASEAERTLRAHGVERAVIARTFAALGHREVVLVACAPDLSAGLPVLDNTTQVFTTWEDIPRLGDLVEPLAPDPRDDDARDTPEPGPPSHVDPVSPVAPAVALTYVAFTVTDRDGAPLRASYRATIDGQTREGELGEGPTRFDELDADADAHVTLRPTGYLRAHRAAPVGADASHADVETAIADEIGPITLPVGKTTQIVVDVPKATVFTLPSYELDLEVFRPGWLWLDDAAREGTTGFGCLAQILAFARAHPERHVLVVGHTDTTGTKKHNRGVAERRAEHLAALLRADVDAWVASCEADAESTDLAAHMRWAASRFGWPCDPGGAAADTTTFREALAAYRAGAHEQTGLYVEPTAPPSSDDWRLAYGLLDVALSEELDLDFAELASLRSGLSWCNPPIVGAGELWPRELVGKNGKASAVNRRTEVLFATEAEIPGGAGSPAGASIYGDDAWLWLDYVDPELRAMLPLSLRSEDGFAVPDTPLRVVSESGRIRYGRLGLAGRTCLDDVAAGEFRVHYLDHEDVTVKIWAMRFDDAVRRGDAATARRALDQLPSLVRDVAAEYGRRFAGGDEEAFAANARSLARGKPDEIVFEFLLDLAGFRGLDQFDYQPVVVRPPAPKEAS